MFSVSYERLRFFFFFFVAKMSKRKKRRPGLSAVQRGAVKLSLESEESDQKWLKSSFVCHYVHYVAPCPIFCFFFHPALTQISDSRGEKDRAPSSSTPTLCRSALLIGHIQNQQGEKQSVTSLHSFQHPLGLTHAQLTYVPLFPCYSSRTPSQTSPPSPKLEILVSTPNNRSLWWGSLRFLSSFPPLTEILEHFAS